MLMVEPEPECALQLSSPESTGLDAGAWCPWNDSDIAGDQSRDDDLSLSFTGEPLEECVEILGAPVLTIETSADEPLALLAVRLCDVAHDGTSRLVTRGLLNLTHRTGSADPQPLEPGRREQVRVPLEAIAYAFPAGHRIRVAVSSSYWPWAWPSPRAAGVTIFTGPASRFELPLRPPAKRDCIPAGLVPPPVLGEINGGSIRRLVHNGDPGPGRFSLEVERTRERRLVPPGTLEIEGAQTDVYRIEEGDPLSAYENGDLIFSRARTFTVPRDLV
jgi:hypothetical protein